MADKINNSRTIGTRFLFGWPPATHVEPKCDMCVVPKGPNEGSQAVYCLATITSSLRDKNRTTGCAQNRLHITTACRGRGRRRGRERRLRGALSARSRPSLGKNDPRAGCIRIARHERHFVLHPDPPSAVCDTLHTQPGSENRSTRSRNQFDQRTWLEGNNRSIYLHNVLSVSASSWRIPQNQEVGSSLSCNEYKE